MNTSFLALFHRWDDPEQKKGWIHGQCKSSWVIRPVISIVTEATKEDGMFRILLAVIVTALAPATWAEGIGGSFESIDGGTLSLEDWRGNPVLVVNTASKCAFTRQYADLQDVYDRYRSRGVVVLAVPSDDFNQELASEAEVKEFCELNYGLDLPMTEITSVAGPTAHAFYKAVRAQTGFEPRWNFNKILIGPDGTVVSTWGSAVSPDSRQITSAIEALLN